MEGYGRLAPPTAVNDGGIIETLPYTAADLNMSDRLFNYLLEIVENNNEMSRAQKNKKEKGSEQGTFYIR